MCSPRKPDFCKHARSKKLGIPSCPSHAVSILSSTTVLRKKRILILVSAQHRSTNSIQFFRNGISEWQWHKHWSSWLEFNSFKQTFCLEQETVKNIVFYLMLHKSYLFFPQFESTRLCTTNLTSKDQSQLRWKWSARCLQFSAASAQRMSYMAKPKLIKSIPCVILTAFISVKTIWLQTFVPSVWLSSIFTPVSLFLFLILSKGELAFSKYPLQMALWL